MPLDVDIIGHWLTTLFWPFIRIGAMFMAAPIFGSRSVPVRIRVLLALFVAWLVSPMIGAVPDVEPVSVPGFFITMQQIVIGLTMGFLLQLAFSAAVMAGQSIAMSMGLGFASVIDPENGVAVPVVSQFFVILSTLLFLSIDGHVIMIVSLVESFHVLPIGLTGVSPDTFMSLISFTGHVFMLALLMALPVLVSVLMVNISLGVVTRAAPQLNIFAVGFPITIMVGVLVMLLSLGVFQTQSMALFADALRLLGELIR